MGRYLSSISERVGIDQTYDALWEWSVTHAGEFWETLWRYLDLDARGSLSPALVEEVMPGARWFPHATVNYTAQALREDRPATAVAIDSYSDTRDPVHLTYGELRDQVAAVRATLANLGVGPGDRVAGYIPNIPEAIVAFLATASLGAVWSSCPPEFGVRGVCDRLGQIRPKVLFGVDGYRFGSRAVPRVDDLAEIAESLPGLAAVICIPYLGDVGQRPEWLSWGDIAESRTTSPELTFEYVPFDHPLYILYTSGTTGLPKPIVHGHGGMLLQHAKDVRLHLDLGSGDRFFWYTTTGWMMWNFLVSGLLVGATVVCFDGDLKHPDLERLWALAARERFTYFGTSASFVMSCRKAGLRPQAAHDFSHMKEIGCTGSALPVEGFEWVRDSVGVPIASSSGGTDVCSILVGHSPLVPIWSGEISCRALGVSVQAFDDDGRPVVDQQGELVITRPLPSMPVGFWGDSDGARYRAAYFDRWPGIWRHGDWITITQRGSCIISGRSDATLNRGGVRLGTAELYATVEDLPEVAESLVIHVEDQEHDELLLFVAPAAGHNVNEELEARICSALRRGLSPRHVPDRIVAAPGVPRTLSGKKLEIPVKRLLTGGGAKSGANTESIADVAIWKWYERWAVENGFAQLNDEEGQV